MVARQQRKEAAVGAGWRARRDKMPRKLPADPSPVRRNIVISGLNPTY